MPLFIYIYIYIYIVLKLYSFVDLKVLHIRRCSTGFYWDSGVYFIGACVGAYSLTK